VWAQKYRKWILRDDLRDFVEQCIKEIAAGNYFEIEEMQIAEAHVYIFLEFALTYSISNFFQTAQGGTYTSCLWDLS